MVIETDRLLGALRFGEVPGCLEHPSRAVSVEEQPMSTYAPSRQESSGTDDEPHTDPRPDYVPLGVDERGAHHVYDTGSETVHIIHPDGSRGRRLLDGGDVDDWMDAVAGSWGWETKKYGVGLVEMLEDALEATDE